MALCARMHARFLKNFVFPVLFGHNYSPQKQKILTRIFSADFEKVRLFVLLGHSAHLGTATCPSSKLASKFEKGDNLMKHVYLAYGGNG